MKRYLILTIMLLAAHGFIFAQDTTGKQSIQTNNDEVQTLFSGKSHHNKRLPGWYVGPTATYTQFGGKSAFMPGIEGGLIINHFFSIGLAGSITANVNNLYYQNVQDTMNAYFVGGYGGVRMEFTVFPKFPVHFSFPLLIGGGSSAYLHKYNNLHNGSNNGDYEVIEWNTFFVLEPGIRAEVNILKFMRFWIGGTYRWVPNYQLMKTSGDFMSNFNISAGLKFGKF